MTPPPAASATPPIDFLTCPDVVFGIWLEINKKWLKTGHFHKLIIKISQLQPFFQAEKRAELCRKQNNSPARAELFPLLFNSSAVPDTWHLTPGTWHVSYDPS